MKKAEELKLYAPEPKRPELDAALCMSVAEGQGMGRYIEGKASFRRVKLRSSPASA